jgi:hypothetical protein
MPIPPWSEKRERQYEHMRGGLRSHRGPGGPTYDQLYNEAKQRNIKGRSRMSKGELARALGR